MRVPVLVLVQVVYFTTDIQVDYRYGIRVRRTRNAPDATTRLPVNTVILVSNVITVKTNAQKPHQKSANTSSRL